MTFGYLWALFVCMCGTIDPGHTYDEYLLLLAKLGMTTYNPRAFLSGNWKTSVWTLLWVSLTPRVGTTLYG
jgi:hypothetical protein